MNPLRRNLETKTWKKRQRHQQKNLYKKTQIQQRKIKKKQHREHGTVIDKRSQFFDATKNSKKAGIRNEDEPSKRHPMPKKLKKLICSDQVIGDRGKGNDNGEKDKTQSHESEHYCYPLVFVRFRPTIRYQP